MLYYGLIYLMTRQPVKGHNMFIVHAYKIFVFLFLKRFL